LFCCTKYDAIDVHKLFPIFDNSYFSRTLDTPFFNMKTLLHRCTVFFGLFLSLTLYPSLAQAQFLKVSGITVVDKNGNEVILRGMGLGGWMLQEGYMLETSSFANPQYEIRARIAALIGEVNTQEFYDAWLENHCTRRDIDSLASWGFNSIRLPMHYNLYTLPIEKEPVYGQNTWLEKGFAMTDSLLAWCKANQMYLILDLHAAPGGQGRDAAISDYDPSKPSLWENDENKNKTIALWRKLASRFANEEWIGGYDLINEPNWNFTPGGNQNGCSETSNAPLRKLYMDITSAIREVDQNHIIIVEGNCWGNNYGGVFPKWDDNMVASFHKYWSNNDQGSIDGAVNIRSQNSLPVWLGESGENSNTWFTNAINLVETNNIGWAWWPLKKVGSVVNPLTVKKNSDYDVLLNYWQNGGTKPSETFAKNALMQLAENLKIENTIYHKDVIDAMFRQVKSSETLPFGDNQVPGTIAMTDFDLGRNGKAYADNDTANYHVSTGNYTAWNTGWSYRNDGVDIEATMDNDPSTNGFNVGWTQDGEWMQYTLHVDSTASYTLTLRYAATSADSKIKLKVNDGDISETISLASTGGYQIWANRVLSDIVLYKGEQKLKFFIEKGGANFGYIKFDLSKKINETAFLPITASTQSDNVILLSLNKVFNETTLKSSDFHISINGAAATIMEISRDQTNHQSVIISIAEEVTYTDLITISCDGGVVTATDGTTLDLFNNLTVINTMPVYFLLPGKIEAENFLVNVGLELESTTDIGGGQNIGYTNAGDYLEYWIKVPTDAVFPLELRIACLDKAGKLKVEQRNFSDAVLNSVIIDVPITGGWQNWRTIKSNIKLDAGVGILRVTILQPEFNINWFNFLDYKSVTGFDIMNRISVDMYPNPTAGYLTIQIPDNLLVKDPSFFIRSTSGATVRTIHFAKIDSNSEIQVDVKNLKPGIYIVEFLNGNNSWFGKFIKI